ncbi:MAG: DUF1553 domain-containing protein [Bryobacterales bacterium]|nr:DUF1553 domain-containing protein [Bryobacterales bacterium]
MLRLLFFVAACILSALAGDVEFNRDIRPVLSDRCFACHGPDAANRKSKLRLDQEQGAKADLGKGRFGIVPGSPERSEVFKRITSSNKALRMPPAYAGHDKLGEREIKLIREWIEQGAPYQQHWSLIPPKRPPTQPTDVHPIDQMVRVRLEREGLHPAPEAERHTLLRRVTLDLTGLQPSPAEVDAFLADRSPGAYEKVVDRLLASPRFGERMAIRWLEAARYSDTNGYQTDGPRDMWRWRDWVIDAYNRNMPFDQFTIEQLAGDLLPHPTLSQRIATGFHRNHRTSAEGGIVDEEFRLEYVADRTETTATVWLGSTLGCARCHDHKYDPFTQKDFYSLSAFFNNVPEKGFVYNFGNEEPFIKAPLPEQAKRLAELDARAASAKQAADSQEQLLEKAQAKWERGLARAKPLEWSVTTAQIFEEPVAGDTHFDGRRVIEGGKESPKIDYRDPFTFSAWIKPQGDGAILSRGEDYFEGHGHYLYVLNGRIRLHHVFRWTDLGMRVESAEPIAMNQWQHIAVTYDGSMKASHVKIYVNGEIQPLKILFDQGIWPLDVKGPWRVGAGGGKFFNGDIRGVRVYKKELTPAEVATLPLEGPVNSIAAKPAASRTQAEKDKLRFCFLDGRAPRKILKARAAWSAAQAERDQYYSGIPTVMVMEEMPRPRVTHVLRRGAYDNPGEAVEARTPAALPPMPDSLPHNRLGLARWLVDKSNPLTARVNVNRYWQMLFGVGLVKTVEDFGSQGEWPVYPEILDWLAVEYMESGWDTKHILKTIVMSGTYRQASRVTPEALQRDPENRLLARGPRVRLSPEMIRDQTLASSGLLVEKVGGPSVKPYQPPGLWQELQGGKGYEQDHGEGLYRRSLYTYWKRTVAPPMMINFDAATRETCVVRETRTNTPLQALNLMNGVTYLEAARKLAERMMLEGGGSAATRLAYGMTLVVARPPSPKEAAILAAALERFRAGFRTRPAQAVEYLKQGESPRDGRLEPEELAAYTGVANLMLNLDQAVTKD